MINDDLGYYLCNGQKFSSKINALIYSKTVNKSVEWIFHNTIFSNYNWKIEPDNTLDYYYDQRAKELREKYDYIILSYSGGSDTHNILESFLRQNLHIDEIVTNHITQITKKITVLDPAIKHSWNFAAEHELQAIPRLKYIREKCPTTKITILDVSDNVLKSLLNFDDADWVLNRNDHLSVGQLFRYNYYHFSNIKKQFDKNIKVAIIVGLDKPKTIIIDNNFYIRFTDTVANITTINDFNSDYTNVNVEMFYWSKSTLDMMCKQAHVIKKFLEKNTKLMPFWQIQANLYNKTLDSYELNRIIHEKVLRDIIYTTWNKNWFQTNKSTFWWNTEFDNWFKLDDTFNQQRLIWNRGIQYLEEHLSEYIKYKNNLPDGLKTFVHRYHIGKMNNEH